MLPCESEQKSIATILSSADSEINALEKKLALLRDQKKDLLNNLVTGTIRLPEFCKEVG
ncbi:MAG: restriction endonuclease subunit S [Candidatus Sabulitectum sp.]|nr:restriction endonuclease subunit S [Candidatus Sabulitectum sp.]